MIKIGDMPEGLGFGKYCEDVTIGVFINIRELSFMSKYYRDKL